MSPNHHYLIISESGRALARSARQARLNVHVLDRFADQDTVDCAQTHRIVTGFMSDDQNRTIIRHVETLSDRFPDLSIVIGSGLEGNLDLLSYLARRFPVIGNVDRVIGQINNPEAFFGTLDDLGLPHPAYHLSIRDRLSDNFLVKSVGGTGGTHIRRYRKGGALRRGDYLQALLTGRSFSVTFLADGRRAHVLGFNELLSRDAGADFTFAGALANADLCATMRRCVNDAVAQLVSVYALRGLCGLDFIVEGGGRYAILELNPRPTATFECYECGESLFVQHLAAFHGDLPERRVRHKQHRAFSVVYAHRTMVMPRLALPAWVTDRPAVGRVIAKDEPVCTVHAADADIAQTKAQLTARMAYCTEQLDLAA